MAKAFSANFGSENLMIDPAVMSNEQLEAALGDVAVKLAEAREAGGKIAELEGRQWRLQFEQRYRREDRG